MSKLIKMSLRAARNIDDMCRLNRDHYDWRDWSIMTDGVHVWISKQKLGHHRTDHIEIPKKIFDALFDRYGTPIPRGRWRNGKFVVGL